MTAISFWLSSRMSSGLMRISVERRRVGQPAVVVAPQVDGRVRCCRRSRSGSRAGRAGPPTARESAARPSSSSFQRRSRSKLSPNSSNSWRLPPMPAPSTARPPKLVERRHLDGEHLRPAARHGRHAGAEQQPLRPGGDGAERDPGIDRRPVPDPRQVIPEEQRLPARLLGLLREPHDVLGLREGADVGRDEPESHQQQV